MTLLSKTTKEKIFEVAINLFSEKGYNGASIRDIAKEVGIKESSIYNHYKGKDAILQAILEYQLDGFNAALAQGDQMGAFMDRFENAIAFWFAGAEAMMAHLPEYNETIATILVNEMFINKDVRLHVLENQFAMQKKLIEGLLAAMKNKGWLRDIDIPATAAQYVYLLYGLDIQHRLQRIEGASLEETNKELFEQLQLFLSNISVGA